MERTEQESPPRSESPVSTTPANAGGAGSAPSRATSRALARTDAKGDARADGRPEGQGRAEARTEVRVPTGSVVPVSSLPSIPAKRYFTIGEVSELCGVKPYVLRYWEQEFTQLRPMKRRGNRRYYQHHEVLLIRRIRELLYEQGFTISGARNQLQEHAVPAAGAQSNGSGGEADKVLLAPDVSWKGPDLVALAHSHPQAAAELREALLSIRDLLG